MTSFFYVCLSLFLRLHVCLPFDEFIMGVLRLLNVATRSFILTVGVGYKHFSLYVKPCTCPLPKRVSYTFTLLGLRV